MGGFPPGVGVGVAVGAGVAVAVGAGVAVAVGAGVAVAVGDGVGVPPVTSTVPLAVVADAAFSQSASKTRKLIAPTKARTWDAAFFLCHFEFDERVAIFLSSRTVPGVKAVSASVVKFNNAELSLFIAI